MACERAPRMSSATERPRIRPVSTSRIRAAITTGWSVTCTACETSRLMTIQLMGATGPRVGGLSVGTPDRFLSSEAFEQRSVLLDNLRQASPELWVLASALDRLDQGLLDRFVETGAFDPCECLSVGGQLVREPDRDVPSHGVMVP